MQVHIFGKKCISHKIEKLNIDKKMWTRKKKQDDKATTFSNNANNNMKIWEQEI
jgi:hypothetical protein